LYIQLLIRYNFYLKQKKLKMD